MTGQAAYPFPYIAPTFRQILGRRWTSRMPPVAEAREYGRDQLQGRLSVPSDVATPMDMTCGYTGRDWTRPRIAPHGLKLLYYAVLTECATF